MDNSVWAGCPPATLSLGTDAAPAAKCELTAAPPGTGAVDSEHGAVGGEWVEHDPTIPELLSRGFLQDTLAAIITDTHGTIRGAVPASTNNADLKALLESRDSRNAWLLLGGSLTSSQLLMKVRTQVTRGIHVHCELALDANTKLAVYALHDAVDLNVRITRAQFVEM